MTDDKNAGAETKMDAAQPAADAAVHDATRPITAEGKWGWLSTTVAIIFGLLFAYELFSAISNVIQLVAEVNATNATLTSVDHDAIAAPWVLLILDMLLPVVIYILAFWLARRRTVPLQALLFLIGLAAVAATTLSINGLAFAATQIT